MLQNPGQGETKESVLPKQAAPPSLVQLKNLQSEALKAAGRTFLLPFGNAPDEFALNVYHDLKLGVLRWTLKRGVEENAIVEWEEINRDVDTIFSILKNRFGTGATTAEHEEADQYRTLKTRVHRATLEGELQDMPITNLLQSIQMNKGTGRLEVESSFGRALVFFAKGEPVHCIFNDGEGDDSLLELLCIEEGEFRFFKEPSIPEHSISRPLQMLLMEGAALHDQMNFLNQAGVALETYLIRNHATMSESLFEQMVADGTACKKDLEKRFYQEVDNQSTLIEILRRVPLKKAQWVPIVFNLVTCGLCSLRSNVPDLNADSRDASIDWGQVRRVETVLRRPDTGVYSYPAFLLFLEKEFFRFERFGREFAVVTLDIKIRRPDQPSKPEPVPVQSLDEVVGRINKLIRRTDMLFHYDKFGFVILMPETNLDSAKTFAIRLAEILMSKRLSKDKGGYPIVAATGFASIPTSCESLGALMVMARPPVKSQVE